MDSIVYYRPEWTSGRYNKEHSVAIYYNLIQGFSYFFEDYSALVMGIILHCERNKAITLEEISKQTNIAEDSLKPFLDELCDMYLLIKNPPTKEFINEYRKSILKDRIDNVMHSQEESIKSKLPFESSNAEMEYMDKVGGVCSVMFELTYNCSEKCIHCYNIGATRNDEEQSHRYNKEELVLSDYIRIIDELYDAGLVKVTLTGGDPFSKPHTWEIIDYLYKKGIVFDIFTNGQKLVNKVQKLADYYPRLVGVSLYSGNAADHDFITRVKGSWSKSMLVIEQLSKLAVPMNIKCCVMRPNVKSYRQINGIAQKYGAKPQFEVNITDSIEGDKCASTYLRLTPDLLKIVLRDSNIPMYVGKEAPNYGGQPRIMDEKSCGAGDFSFCITPTGDMIPCCSFHLLLGNLKEQTITDILTQSKNLKFWRHLTLRDYEECGTHDYCDYCNLCAGNNYSEHKTPLKAAENNCYMAKQRYNLAMEMMKGYDPLENRSIDECLEDIPVVCSQKIRKIFN